jgi:hypothetical protein
LPFEENDNDKSERGSRDQGLVSGIEEYEVRYFADKHGISIDRAQELIGQHGDSRAKLDEAARKLRG